MDHLDIRAFAVCDGKTDDAAGLQTALRAAKFYKMPLRIPANTAVAYGSVPTVDGVALIGEGPTSVLYALNEAKEALFVKGTEALLQDFRLSGVAPTKRMAPFEYSRIAVLGALDWVVMNVTIDASAGAGIIASRSAKNGLIEKCTITNTLADSVHITDKTSDVRIEKNSIENSGDDGIAVVSYRAQGDVCKNVVAYGNVIRNNKGGRMMSVVGGYNVVYEHNVLDTCPGAAGLYLAQEEAYKTFGARNVTAQRNTLINCGNLGNGHYAVMLFSNGYEPNSSITLRRNLIVQSNGIGGIRIYGDNTNVDIDSNVISGSITPLNIATPGVTVTPFTGGQVGAQT